jgi:type II secretory pathway pseudopilin PulG
MIELLVVIGIIALLLAIAVPTANRVVDSQRRNNTMANMQVIENAIAAYRRCTRSSPPSWFSIADLDPPYPNGETWDRSTQDSNQNKRWDFGEPFDHDDGDKQFEPVNIRKLPGVSGKQSFHPVVRLPNFDHDVYTAAQLANTKDHKRTEAMYLWMTLLCPESKQILSGLPSKMITNEDDCGGVRCSDYLVFDSNGNGSNDQPYNQAGKDQTVDLFELRDEWGEPLHYVTPDLGDPDVTDRRAQQIIGWELRSYGPNGRPDGNTGTPEDQNGDDVVLRGQ